MTPEKRGTGRISFDYLVWRVTIWFGELEQRVSQEVAMFLVPPADLSAERWIAVRPTDFLRVEPHLADLLAQPEGEHCASLDAIEGYGGFREKEREPNRRCFLRSGQA
jgi:hypothetical protein